MTRTLDQQDAYTLHLRACQNPDFGRRTLPKPTQVEVATLAEASRTLRVWCSANDLGGGNVPNQRVTVRGRTVARVSFNGRVWTPEPWPSNREIL